MEEGAINLEMFMAYFLDHFIQLELRVAKVMGCMYLRQDAMTKREYSLKFTKWSKYSPSLVADSRAHMNKFTMGMFNLVKI